MTGAGRGIGRALALHLASNGRPLALCARSRDELDDTAARARDLGVAVVARVVDVTDAAAVRAFAELVGGELGAPWGLVNNAAILGPVGPIDKVPIDEWTQAILVDVGGVAACTGAFVSLMRNAGGGRIINLSGAGIGGPGIQQHVSAYTASKGAIAALTETLGRELAGAITVNAVAPGAQPTKLVDDVVRAGPVRAGDDLYRAMVSNQASPTALDGFFSIVDFLLSNESAWLTGKLLSARWDQADALREARARLENTSLLTLRRIDDSMFSEVTP